MMVGIPAWRAVAERLAATQRPLIALVIGAMDTGKSTLCAFLARRLFEGGWRVAVVDADLGQSDIGLPTTIGMGFVERPIERLAEIPLRAAYFVGSLSPVGHLLPTVTGTKLLVERALALGADAVIVDTDGLVHGGVGWALKHYTFELLRPTHVLLLQRAHELIPFERQWRHIMWVQVLSVPVPDAVAVKTREMRRAFRQQRFREWLAGCQTLTLPLAQARLRNTLLGQGIAVPPAVLGHLSSLLGTSVLHAERVGDTVLVVVSAPPTSSDFSAVRQFWGGAPYIRWVTPDRYEQVIVGLLDGNNELLTVGVTFQLDFVEATLTVLAPPIDPDRVRAVVFGFLRLALDGTELETLPPEQL